MDIAFQILMPGYNYDLGHAGKGPSDGWFFFTSYNSEQANTKLEENASQNDKDFIAAVNYKRAEECVAERQSEDHGGRVQPQLRGPEVAHREGRDEDQREGARSEGVRGVVYYLPTPKSPHGVDVDPTGEYIVAGGKLATVIPVHSFTKMQKAIAAKPFDGEIDDIPVLKYDAVLAGEVQKPGLGPCTRSSTARATRTRRCSSRPKS